MARKQSIEVFQPEIFSDEVLLKLLRETTFDLYQAGMINMQHTYHQCCMIQEEIGKRLKSGSNATDGRRSASRG